MASRRHVRWLGLLSAAAVLFLASGLPSSADPAHSSSLPENPTVVPARDRATTQASPLTGAPGARPTVDGDDPAVLAALLRALHSGASKRRCEHLMLGLAEINPLRNVVARAYRQTTCTSQFYLAT